MSSGQVHRHNHFVPRAYLKRWANAEGRIWTYRTLVSEASVPSWRLHSVRGVAYHEHLYSRMAAGGVSDEFEQWLAQTIETPAEEALQKVINHSRLTPADWNALLDFFAATQGRTPAHLLRRMQAWDVDMPRLLDSVLKETTAKLDRGEIAAPEGVSFKQAGKIEMPVLARARRNPDGRGGVLEAEMVLGRGLWLYELERMIVVTAKHLRRLNWTILRPPVGSTWLTSDDPVMCLNYNSAESFNFKGGWGSRGTELILPLSPEHLLYAQVGQRAPLKKYSRVSQSFADVVQRMIVLHGHRMLFACEPSEFVGAARPRAEDRAAFEHERAEWLRFHANQSEAETSLRAGVGRRIAEDGVEGIPTPQSELQKPPEAEPAERGQYD